MRPPSSLHASLNYEDIEHISADFSVYFDVVVLPREHFAFRRIFLFP